MRDLVLFLYEVELLGYPWVIAELVFARLRQDLDHVLHTHTDRAFIQHGTKAVKDGMRSFRCLFREKRAHFARKRHSQLDTVIRRVLQQQHQDLERQKLVHDPLIHEMRKKLKRRMALGLIVPPK